MAAASKKKRRKRVPRTDVENEARAERKLDEWMGKLDLALSKVRRYQRKLKYYRAKAAGFAVEKLFDAPAGES